MGFSNFYHYFIYNYSDIATFIIQLILKKNFLELQCFLLQKNSIISKRLLPPLLFLLTVSPTPKWLWKSCLRLYFYSYTINYDEKRSSYSHILFLATELNYDIYSKEFLAVFKAIWHHYLQVFKLSIDIIIDYEILEYFSTTKVFFHYHTR